MTMFRQRVLDECPERLLVFYFLRLQCSLVYTVWALRARGSTYGTLNTRLHVISLRRWQDSILALCRSCRHPYFSNLESSGVRYVGVSSSNSVGIHRRLDDNNVEQLDFRHRNRGVRTLKVSLRLFSENPSPAGIRRLSST